MSSGTSQGRRAVSAGRVAVVRAGTLGAGRSAGRAGVPVGADWGTIAAEAAAAGWPDAAAEAAAAR